MESSLKALEGFSQPNIVLVGDPYVGKSSLLVECHKLYPTLTENGFCRIKLPPHEYRPTSLKSYPTDIFIVEDFLTNESVFLMFDYRVNIVDTGGSHRYDYIRPLAYKNATIFLLCFDVTDRKTFESITSRWLPAIQKYKPGKPIIVVGTKTDRHSERQVTSSEAEQLTKTLGENCQYYETSIYEGYGYLVFYEALKSAYFCWRSKQNAISKWKRRITKLTRSRQPDLTNLEAASYPPEYSKRSSDLVENWKTTLHSNIATDVVLKFSDESQEVCAHKFVLALASETFRGLLQELYCTGTNSLQNDSTKQTDVACREEEPVSTVTREFPEPFTQVLCLNKEIAKTCNDTDNMSCYEPHKLQITFDSTVKHTAFKRVLDWIYIGTFDVSEESEDFVEELLKVTLTLKIKPLEFICQCILKLKRKKHFPSETNNLEVKDVNADPILPYERMWRDGKGLFAHDFLTDLVFVVEGTPVSLHQVVLITRSPVMAAMLDGNFKEKGLCKIKLPDVPLDHFHTVCEFIYTDNCLLDESNVQHIMELADRFCIESLVERCEEYLIESIKNTLRNDQSDTVDLIMDALYLSKVYSRAVSLNKWCLHFIATSFHLFENHVDIDSVWEENKEYLESNQWPPKDYLKALSKFSGITKQCNNVKKGKEKY